MRVTTFSSKTVGAFQDALEDLRSQVRAGAAPVHCAVCTHCAEACFQGSVLPHGPESLPMSIGRAVCSHEPWVSSAASAPMHPRWLLS